VIVPDIRLRDPQEQKGLWHSHSPFMPISSNPNLPRKILPKSRVLDAGKTGISLFGSADTSISKAKRMSIQSIIPERTHIVSDKVKGPLKQILQQQRPWL
jgi:hypothetical protein